MIYLIPYAILLLLLTILASFVGIRLQFSSKRKNVIGFFHPYCNDGGGGERVLWWAVKVIQEISPDYRIAIFTGKDSNTDENKILDKVKNHFNINIDGSKLDFVWLEKRWLVEDYTYPRFTLLGQSIGSMLLAWEAINKLNPRVFIDSMGYSFTYPIFKYFGGSQVACYVHYPTISTDMLNLVYERRPTYNNQSGIAGSQLKSRAKLLYYEIFAKIYGFMGSRADAIMVNSTWTKNHIVALWKLPQKTHIVFPPCNTTEFQQIKLENRQKFIISIGQFRPEKDHNLQLDSFKVLLKKYPHWKGKVKLVLIGSSRNKDDQARVDHLIKRCNEEDLKEHVIFQVNAKFGELKEWLAKAMIGVHTMWNEHFGIGVVEFMAAGVIAVAHNSGGPKEDIVVQFDGNKTGFLAVTAEEFAEAFNEILNMNEEQRIEIQKNARKSANRFSEEVFAQRCKKCISDVL